MGTFAVSVEHPSAILVGYGPKASVNGEIAQGVHICAFSKENMFWCDGVAGSECHCPGKLLFLRTLRVDRKFRSSPGDATYPVFRSQHQLLLFKVERFGALIDFVGKSLFRLLFLIVCVRIRCSKWRGTRFSLSPYEGSRHIASPFEAHFAWGFGNVGCGSIFRSFVAECLFCFLFVGIAQYDHCLSGDSADFANTREGIMSFHV